MHSANEISKMPWPPPSTRGPERRLIGRHPQRRLTGFSYQPTKIVLRRPLESAQYVSIKYTERLAEAGIEPAVGAASATRMTTRSPRR